MSAALVPWWRCRRTRRERNLLAVASRLAVLDTSSHPPPHVPPHRRRTTHRPPPRRVASCDAMADPCASAESPSAETPSLAVTPPIPLWRFNPSGSGNLDGGSGGNGSASSVFARLALYAILGAGADRFGDFGATFKALAILGDDADRFFGGITFGAGRHWPALPRGKTTGACDGVAAFRVQLDAKSLMSPLLYIIIYYILYY